MRTFVISDAHGCPEVILNAFRHGGFDPGRDAFVFAGDAVDRGPDAEGCLRLVERYATEVLLGNHDLAALFGFHVFPQNPESLSFRPLLLERALSGQWKAATSVEGVLVTHAGVSKDYERMFEDECASDPARLAERFNATFRALVEWRDTLHRWYDDALLGDCGPFWFRPRPYSDLLPLLSCVQIAGHTVPLTRMEGTPFHMIDPTPADGGEDPRRYRYALVEQGTVVVRDGRLGEREGRLPGSPWSDEECA